ncbi:MAG: hypothetical protein M9894_36060 [Planctomycetes bacterium]|nr:hypothetical protein [Planctomycetota bacterium]
MTRAALAPLALLIAACAGPRGHDGAFGGEVAAVGSRLAPSPGAARALAASLEPAGGGALEDGLVRRRVAALAAEVAQACHAPPQDLTVLDTGDVVLRALPGGHLQVSRGLLVACAGPDALERVAALLAHAAAHAALGHADDHLARDLRRHGVAALASSVTPLVEGEAAAADDARALGLALRLLARPERPGAGCDEADARALAALEGLGVAAPARALEAAYAALASVEERDPAAAAPLLAVHGPLADRLRGARAAPPRTPLRPVAREPLDLSPLVEQVEAHAALDAADLLLRRGAADGALRLAGEQKGPRAAALRAEALAALGREREADRALRAALLLDPGSHRARLALGALYARAQPAGARGELEQAVRRAPLDPLAHLLLAQVTDEPDRRRARLVLAEALAGGEGPWARQAAAALAPARQGAPPPPDPGRARILSGSGRR